MAVEKPGFIKHQAFAEMLVAQAPMAIIDCRDNDRQKGGWIRGSTHFPSRQASEAAFVALLEQLKKDKIQHVVFHCVSSLGRGPNMATRFVSLFPPAVRGNMDVLVLEGGVKGFIQWTNDNAKHGLIVPSGFGSL